VPKESPSLKVPRICGQIAIVSADKLGLRDKALEVQKEGKFIVVPLVRQPTEEEIDLLKGEVPEVLVEVGSFQERKQEEKTLEDVLAGSLPTHLMAGLPRALDVIGDIAVVEIPVELKPYEKLIGEAILTTHRNVKTVLAKTGAVGGTYRTRDFTIIAGEPRTRAVHKEFGCQYQVDVANAYFSPRLSHEHERVASLVREGETVVDLFAGVGPFSVLIGKRHPTAKVYALDINPAAYELLKKNVLLNRVQSNVIPILGDARQIVQEKLSGVADRVVMNLPASAIGFIDVACEAVKPEGGMVHFYSFVRLPDTVETLKSRFALMVERSGSRVERFLSARAVRETAPYEQQVVLDARVI
jgi:tRNA (guanine37-N1)-methyltransferase